MAERGEPLTVFLGFGGRTATMCQKDVHKSQRFDKHHLDRTRGQGRECDVTRIAVILEPSKVTGFQREAPVRHVHWVKHKRTREDDERAIHEGEHEPVDPICHREETRHPPTSRPPHTCKADQIPKGNRCCRTQKHGHLRLVHVIGADVVPVEAPRHIPVPSHLDTHAVHLASTPSAVEDSPICVHLDTCAVHFAVLPQPSIRGTVGPGVEPIAMCIAVMKFADVDVSILCTFALPVLAATLCALTHVPGS
mmetsp:Transcript_15270/g.39275  ORF Transcript_15270/g.39275 Transcript_15270/m.39275 type:complete len:251 (-) Transcript_15270:832-1584(-)